MNSCAVDRCGRLKDRVRHLARRFAGSVMLASQLEPLVRLLEQPSEPAVAEAVARLRELSEISPVIRTAMEEYDRKESLDRAEAFLADLAEDRSSAPPEIVPLIDQYIARLRELIARSWQQKTARREIDAHVMQVRLSYSQDLDRILQGLRPNLAG
ncbi:MAG: hypothetical protein HY293_17070 [Planctomycetes bacterium]|nr:hypothetical protein [Planctomycetota bacterium]